MSVLNTVNTKSFDSVKDFLATNNPFSRVYYVPFDLKGKDWFACPSYPSEEELLKDFGDDCCDYQIFVEPDCIKKNLVIYTKKAIKPGALFEEV